MACYPINESVETHLLIDGQYKFQGVFTKEDTVTINIFNEMKIDLNQIFL